MSGKMMGLLLASSSAVDKVGDDIPSCGRCGLAVGTDMDLEFFEPFGLPSPPESFILSYESRLVCNGCWISSSISGVLRSSLVPKAEPFT